MWLHRNVHLYKYQILHVLKCRESTPRRYLSRKTNVDKQNPLCTCTAVRVVDTTEILTIKCRYSQDPKRR
jgi:hypothetical protein